jgi:hypothetical protein
MPKGVYDRSKATPKAGKTAAAPTTVKGKRGRKPIVVEVAPSVGKSTDVSTNLQPDEVSLIEKFFIIRDNLHTLVSIRTQVGDSIGRSVDAEINEEVAILASLRRQLFAGVADPNTQTTISAPAPLPPPLAVPVPPVSAVQ